MPRTPFPAWVARTALVSVLLLGGCSEPVAEPERLRITIASGDNQVAPAGSELASPLAVKVTDSRDRPVPFTRVAFAVSETGGFVNAASPTVTDDDGYATVRRRLGPIAGVHETTATVVGRTNPAVRFRSVGQVQGATQMTVHPADDSASRADTVLATLPPCWPRCHATGCCSGTRTARRSPVSS